MSAEILMHAVGLRQVFDGVAALDGVNLTIRAGARHALIGPNGAGKTTLLNLLAGTHRPTAGTITWLGRDITRHGHVHRARAGIARSFQTPTVIPSLSTVDNLVVAAWPHALNSWRWPPQRFRRLLTRAMHQLETVGLTERADHPAGALSHGQRRLLDIAMALVAGPRLLLLDEPAAGLDSDAETAQLLRLLAALPPSTAVLLVEHHLAIVAAAATTVTVLHQGTVVATGSQDQIVGNPPVRAAYPGLVSRGEAHAAR